MTLSSLSPFVSEPRWRWWGHACLPRSSAHLHPALRPGASLPGRNRGLPAPLAAGGFGQREPWGAQERRGRVWWEDFFLGLAWAVPLDPGPCSLEVASGHDLLTPSSWVLTPAPPAKSGPLLPGIWWYFLTRSQKASNTQCVWPRVFKTWLTVVYPSSAIHP